MSTHISHWLTTTYNQLSTNHICPRAQINSIPTLESGKYTPQCQTNSQRITITMFPKLTTGYAYLKSTNHQQTAYSTFKNIHCNHPDTTANLSLFLSHSTLAHEIGSHQLTINHQPITFVTITQKLTTR